MSILFVHYLNTPYLRTTGELYSGSSTRTITTVEDIGELDPYPSELELYNNSGWEKIFDSKGNHAYKKNINGKDVVKVEKTIYGYSCGCPEKWMHVGSQKICECGQLANIRFVHDVAFSKQFLHLYTHEPSIFCMATGTYMPHCLNKVHSFKDDVNFEFTS